MGTVADSVDTVSVLANRRHLAALDVTRGTAARVQDMAEDIGVVGCRECSMSGSRKSMGAYVSFDGSTCNISQLAFLHEYL
jgi:hypothetical protein